MDRERNRVCPVELANSLDNKIRRWLQNPRKILSPYIRKGMTVLDIGCGPGFFSVEVAQMVGRSGQVIAADLQEGMLERLRSRIKGTELEERITLVKCAEDSINISESVDFILAFYMVHEVPDKNSFFKELSNILKETGQVLIVEPKFFHVSQREFELTIRQAQDNGFRRLECPKLPFSWSAILRRDLPNTPS
jgi:ubiquinone/menaquinone biosynthesis C-methylase UbiE